MHHYIALGACLMLAACATTTSESMTASATDGQAAAADALPAEAEVASGERIVCSSDPVIGTRLPKRRVCRTEKEWAIIAERSHEEVDRAQRAPLPNSAQDL